MKIKAFILTLTLALSLLCACGNNNDTSKNDSNDYVVLEGSTASGSFADPVFIEDPGTDTVIVEMP